MSPRGKGKKALPADDTGDESSRTSDFVSRDDFAALQRTVEELSTFLRSQREDSSAPQPAAPAAGSTGLPSDGLAQRPAATLPTAGASSGADPDVLDDAPPYVDPAYGPGSADCSGVRDRPPPQSPPHSGFLRH